MFFRRKPPADRLSNHQLVERFRGEVRDALDAALGRAGMGPRSPVRHRTRSTRCGTIVSDAARNVMIELAATRNFEPERNDEELEYAIRSKMTWRRDGTDWVLFYDRRRMGRVVRLRACTVRSSPVAASAIRQICPGPRIASWATPSARSNGRSATAMHATPENAHKTGG
jgi:hypothetical protein